MVSSLMLISSFQSCNSSVKPVDSSTFVRPKAKSQEDTDNIENVEDAEGDDLETDMAAMDYEQLMSYFESLKESSA